MVLPHRDGLMRPLGMHRGQGFLSGPGIWWRRGGCRGTGRAPPSLKGEIEESASCLTELHGNCETSRSANESKIKMRVCVSSISNCSLRIAELKI